MTYGSWTQWRRRCEQGNPVMYIVCFEHPITTTCNCMAPHFQDWLDRHGVDTGEWLSNEEAGRNAAGLEALP